MSLEAFHQQCLQGDEKWVSTWVKSNKDEEYINGVDNNGCTGLQLAAAGGHLNLVELLIKHGASLNSVDYTVSFDFFLFFFVSLPFFLLR
ncbi:unnamed protein product [Allacma fusca]|uniref:ANK_REP_REGION domain-containing protein n=1 Tax=Allacma fusca TaxID=39272 RepID=A0A8J2K3K8_9HEXA|nr:unnamed protein product [Allacma fusca]